ncbi:MICOS complex subunit mic25-a-like isoform X2 [Stegostoma tigrinum]|uniref:MICOS complex subunit mic25-a-like isoform X2 n=1 Tax=Stegostoma tigrinum TaxID=3053191 RepID=UPI00286FCB9E|nr:MICOS complex subunit mic25-a-like isoform X2 [Stegostoma tigrinum]
MGASGSTRRVSFGKDDQERVTVLQGMRLSENLVSRMKDLPQSKSKPSHCISGGPDYQGGDNMTLKHSGTEEEMYKRYEKEALAKEEKPKLAPQEQVVAIADLKEQVISTEEQKNIKQLTSQLEKKEADLQRLEVFYKEQLDLIEQKHDDYYQLASAQFNEAASIAEVRVKSRSYEPLCANLQSQILNCYQENPQLTLKCSAFAKEYRHCIREAQKMLLVNHG